MTMPFNDLREFIDAARALGQVKEIHGAHWNLEIGALTELFAFKEPSPLVLFDQIPDHNPNFRVAANLINTPTRSGLDRRHARRRGAHRTRRALERIAKGSAAHTAARALERPDPGKRQNRRRD